MQAGVAAISLMCSLDIPSALRKKLTNKAIVAGVLSFLSILPINNSVQAAVFACSSPDGISFQDSPCVEIETVSSSSPSKQATLYPLSIHSSWFDKPEHAGDRAFCDRRRCECGDLTRRYENSQVQAVADALYLDGNWHRYNTLYKKWTSTPASDVQTLNELRSDMYEASCEIMISQQILRNYAEDVMAQLIRDSKEAENRGFDVEEPCLQHVAQACSFYKTVRLLKQLRTDAASLARARTPSTGLDVVSTQSE